MKLAECSVVVEVLSCFMFYLNSVSLLPRIILMLPWVPSDWVKLNL